MDRWVGKVAVVTGASSGIGAAIAEKLVEAGVNVVGLARRSQNIEELAHKLKNRNCKGTLYAFQTDMGQEEDIVKAFQWIKEKIGVVHILVNNAGMVPQTTLCDGDTTLWRQTVNVNFLAVAIATKHAIKAMNENKVDGHIIHINSIAGHNPLHLPKLNVYPGTKYGVTAMTETLRYELACLKSKIKVTSVSPGAVHTPMVTKDNPDLADSMSTCLWLEAEDIANGVMYVLGTPPHVQVHELTIRPVGELL